MEVAEIIMGIIERWNQTERKLVRCIQLVKSTDISPRPRRQYFGLGLELKVQQNRF